MSEAAGENGILVRGPWRDELLSVAQSRWPQATASQLREGLARIDLSGTPRGACPGFNDVELLMVLSAAEPRALVFGFYCDRGSGSEGARLFVAGRAAEARRAVWSEAQPPDPIAWPIGALALSLEVPVAAITAVERPPRPPLATATEALLQGERPVEAQLTYQALELLGQVPYDEATSALVRHLQAEDWVERFHAARGYARLPRGHGQDGRPRLDALMGDADESVREAVLRGIGELLPEVAFSDDDLQAQIDAAVARGLGDEDEDVRLAAGEVRGLRERLLG